jgi:hypothetical protein
MIVIKRYYDRIDVLLFGILLIYRYLEINRNGGE